MAAARKTVTVFFSDIVDSTRLGEQLDPESLRRVIGRYFDETRAILERHGGRLEKFIGDAVVAIFGVPTTREDDALRALRAADEIRERLGSLNEDFERELGIRLEIRTGVHTGEVVVDEDGRDGFTASGDTMNVAARLEQSAAAGEILIGAPTRLLGGDAVVVEDVEPLEVKGKSERVPAFRLLSVREGVAPYARRQDAPFVGRETELARLHAALDRSVRDRRCVLETLVGTAGVGKSRLTHEFTQAVEPTATVLVGRCEAYGEGITFRPLADALAPVLGEDPRAAARDLLGAADRAETVAERVAEALGATDADGPGEDLAWAFRRLLEAIAAERPLVLVLDDVHWAEPTLLDLVEYLVAFSSGSPILVLCLSRPELLADRPTWATPRENAGVTALEPLRASESLVLLHGLDAHGRLEADEARRILQAADGNPLFLEQLLALNVGRDAGSALVVPPTIQALLVARLDQLDAGERLVLECAAVEGEEFHRATLYELLPDEARPGLGAVLLALARRNLVRPLVGRDGGEDEAFGFGHALIRDAAYKGIPKERRAELHVLLATLLERAGSPTELVGNHLAEAVRYRIELGLRGQETDDLSHQAVQLLGAAGVRALDLGDDRSAARLLERAVSLGSEEAGAILPLRIEYGRALAGVGQLERARAVYEGIRKDAATMGLRSLGLRAELGVLSADAQTRMSFLMADLQAAAERAIPVFEGERDERGLARSSFLIHWALFRTGRYDGSIDAAEKAVAHARTAGDSRELLRALGAIAMATLWGSTPVDEGLRRCDDILERANRALLVEAFVARVRGGFFSMTGAFDEGREHCRRSTEIFEELGHPISAIGVASELQRVERKAGRFDVAEQLLRDAYERLTAVGDTAYAAWILGQLALVLAELGRYDEAMRLATDSRPELQKDHAFAQIATRTAEAAALLAQGDLVQSRSVANDAYAWVRQTDMLDLEGDIALLLAELDRAEGRELETAEHIERAIALYERKGDVVSAAKAREASARAK